MRCRVWTVDQAAVPSNKITAGRVIRSHYKKKLLNSRVKTTHAMRAHAGTLIQHDCTLLKSFCPTRIDLSGWMERIPDHVTNAFMQTYVHIKQVMTDAHYIAMLLSYHGCLLAVGLGHG